MANLTKIPLSGSTHGRGIKVTQTAIATGDTIHTATSGATDGLGDIITIKAMNSHTADVILTLGWGGTTDPDDLIDYTVPTGEYHVIEPGMLLRNTLIVKAAASVANVVVIFGEVTRAT